MTEPEKASAGEHLLPSIGVLCDAAREAGEIALRYHGNAPKTWLKSGNSPVTEADIAIDRMLHKELREAYPGFGWLSEEIDDDGTRLDGKPTFIVDPIDGTRGFMAGSDEWVVSIALVDKGDPVRAVLFNPIRGTLMYAVAGGGAHLEGADGMARAMKPTGKATLKDALVAYPGRARIGQPHRKAPRLASLALRIAYVADGQFDGCVASSGAQDWDIAAADLLVREAGLVTRYRDGSVPRYDRAATDHPVLLCGTPELCDALAAY